MGSVYSILFSEYKTYSTDTHFNFSIKVEKFSKYLTPAFKLTGIPWRIMVIKRAADGDDVIDVFLECLSDFKSNASDWSCEARAIIKLLSDTPDQQPYEKKTPKMEFNKDLYSNGLAPFISWEDLQRYEQNGEVCFGVHLSANPVKLFKPSEIEQTRKKFRFTIENVSKLGVGSSTEEIIRGNIWYVYVRKRHGHLGIFLADKRNSQNENWTWKAKCSFKLLSFDEDVNPIVRKLEKIFYFEGRSWSWGFEKFVSWEELTKETKKYVLGDKAIFEIDLEVEPPKPSWNFVCEQSKPDIGILECAVCLRSVIGREPTATKCGHLFCERCIKRTIEERKKCPLCNVGASLPDLRPIFLTT